MSRWTAAALHLLVSAFIICIIGATLVFVWYTPELFSLGADRLIVILGIIDITIGPLLTLIVYKKGKPSLRFDLTVIALLQAAFLAYGVYIMWQARPVFLVGVLDRFELVFSNELQDEDLANARAELFRTRSWRGPIIVGGELAKSSDERLQLALSGFSGKDIHLMPDRYAPYAMVAAELAARAKPAAELMALSPEAASTVAAELEAAGHRPESVVFVPITSRHGQLAMLLEGGTGNIIGPVQVDPWPDVP